MIRTRAGLIGALVLGLALTGCSSAPNGESESATPSTQSTPEASASASASAQPAADAEQEYFDNMVIFRAGWTGMGAEYDAFEKYPDVAWDDADEYSREAMIGLAQQACDTPIPTSVDESGDRFSMWMSAKFLCPERLADAEAALRAYTSDESVELYEATLWRGDLPASDVLYVLSLCQAEVEMGWDIEAAGYTTAGSFCWIARANAIDANGLESDFTDMFTESGVDAGSFEKLAQELGATPKEIFDIDG